VLDAWYHRGVPKRGATFRATLFKIASTGGWHFVTVPEALAPPVTEGWGRTPVRATVDGHTWETSVWRDKGKRTLLAVPKKVRGEKGHGDEVEVRITAPGARPKRARGPAAAFGGRRPR
jgi:hypothetical protein